MSQLHPEKFPADIAKKVTGGAQFYNDIITFRNGNEHRFKKGYCRYLYEVDFAELNPVQLSLLEGFFMARQGNFYSFYFKDMQDYQACLTVISSIDNGTNRLFQLSKIYGNDDFFYERKITSPIEQTVKIYVDNILQSDNDYVVDYLNGTINFTQPVDEQSIVTADFEFYVNVRFLESRFSRYNQKPLSSNVGKLTMMEVL